MSYREKFLKNHTTKQGDEEDAKDRNRIPKYL